MCSVMQVLMTFSHLWIPQGANQLSTAEPRLLSCCNCRKKTTEELAEAAKRCKTWNCGSNFAALYGTFVRSTEITREGKATRNKIRITFHHWPVKEGSYSSFKAYEAWFRSHKLLSAQQPGPGWGGGGTGVGHMGFHVFWESSWLKNLIWKILILSPNPFNFIGQIVLNYLSVHFQLLMLRVYQVECPHSVQGVAEVKGVCLMRLVVRCSHS